MFNIADIWKHQSYDNALHYLLLENLGTPPHWYAFNIDKGRNLLVLYVLSNNQGSVLYVIKDKNVFTL